MPWYEVDRVSERQEFVVLAEHGEVAFRELCRRFAISPKTGYKWLQRFAEEGPPGLADRLRRPHSSPSRTTAAVEIRVIEMRAKYPSWGARKLWQKLLEAGLEPPSPSTITAI